MTVTVHPVLQPITATGKEGVYICVLFPAHWALLYQEETHRQQGFLFGNIISVSQPSIVTLVLDR